MTASWLPRDDGLRQLAGDCNCAELRKKESVEEVKKASAKVTAGRRRAISRLHASKGLRK